MLPTVASTLMRQKMPIVIPNKEINVRSLFFNNSCKAILKLLVIISMERRITMQIYRIVGEKRSFIWLPALVLLSSPPDHIIIKYCNRAGSLVSHSSAAYRYSAFCCTPKSVARPSRLFKLFCCT